jgi:hypothetical protein
MAEIVIGLDRTEVIRRRSPWRSLAAVELATVALGLLPKVAAALPGLLRCCSQRGDWFNLRRLLEPFGNVPAAEPEAAFSSERRETVLATYDPNQSASGQPGAVQINRRNRGARDPACGGTGRKGLV